MSTLERDFFSSPGEHLEKDCWCNHPRESHRFDPVRDYRELLCEDCKKPIPMASCAFCDKTYTTKEGLMEHVLRKHWEDR